MEQISPEKKAALVQKLKSLGVDGSDDNQTLESLEKIQKSLTPDESQVLDALRARRMLRAEDLHNLDNFTLDVIDGLAPNMQRGKLGLVRPTARKATKADLYNMSFLEPENVHFSLEEEEKAPIAVEEAIAI
jgi:hypothetical protein